MQYKTWIDYQRTPLQKFIRYFKVSRQWWAERFIWLLIGGIVFLALERLYWAIRFGVYFYY